MASQLEITAIVLASLSGLFGVYFVLFILAIWSTYRHGTVAGKRLRIVIVLLFLDLTAHFIARSLEFSRARVSPQPDNETYKWAIPLTVVGNVTTSLAGLLSDGVVAWRFYVIYGRQKWALYIPAGAVIINAMLCLSADAQHLAIYHNYDFYENTLLDVTLNITIAWGWFMFAVNTLLTASIFGKVFYVARLGRKAGLSSSGGSQYSTVLKAVIESALVTWIGLLMYEISSLAPAGHVTSNYDIGYVMLCIIPIFFGISQCLIIVRLGFAKETNSLSTTKASSYGHAGPVFAHSAQSDTLAREALPYKSAHSIGDAETASTPGSANFNVLNIQKEVDVRQTGF